MDKKAEIVKKHGVFVPAWIVPRSRGEWKCLTERIAVNTIPEEVWFIEVEDDRIFRDSQGGSREAH